jgi:hypothetical protein
MATVKIKFRPSTVDGGHYRSHCYEWNIRLLELVLPEFNDDRKRYLSDNPENYLFSFMEGVIFVPCIIVQSAYFVKNLMSATIS